MNVRIFVSVQFILAFSPISCLFLPHALALSLYFQGPDSDSSPPNCFSFPHVLCKDCFSNSAWIYMMPSRLLPVLASLLWIFCCFGLCSFPLFPEASLFSLPARLSASHEPVCLSSCLPVSLGFHLSCNTFMLLHLPAL